jgi:hypothetical protein
MVQDILCKQPNRSWINWGFCRVLKEGSLFYLLFLLFLFSLSLSRYLSLSIYFSRPLSLDFSCNFFLSLFLSLSLTLFLSLNLCFSLLLYLCCSLILSNTSVSFSEVHSALFTILKNFCCYSYRFSRSLPILYLSQFLFPLYK